MKKQLLHTIGAFFLLVVFLIPQAEVLLHALEHEDDIHCFSADKHYHNAEHHCSLCDYVLHKHLPDTTPEFVLIIRNCFISFAIPYSTRVTNNSYNTSPGRAPPVSFS